MIKICLTVLSILFLGANGQDDCIRTSDEYIGHLEELFDEDSNPALRQLCPDAMLMTRIQNMNDLQYEAQTLNQYGGYWTFGSGPDVANKFLVIANRTRNKADFVTQALIYVGFTAEEAQDPGLSQLVVFDKTLMDIEWGASEAGQSSFLAIWEDVFSYLKNSFQVCVNPEKGNGNSITTPDQCETRTVDIPEPARGSILGMNYLKMTGCTKGYPYPEGRQRESAQACEDRCPNEHGAEYCSFLMPMQTANYNSSIVCIDNYLAQKEFVDGYNTTLLARAFFEQCLSFNGLFTGLGQGYNIVANEITGSEYIVRGDIDLEKLGANEPYPLY